MVSYTYEHLELGDEHCLGCKNCRMKNGYDLPVPKKLSLDEIAAHAEKFSKSIFDDWNKLGAIIKRFEATIQKRWLKKSLKQKHEILLKARPGIPTTHRPDFVNFRGSDRRGTAPRSRTCPSEAYLWPYLNLEDLQQHRLLLLFLNSRGRNPPETFVQADAISAHVGRGWGEYMIDKPPAERISMQFSREHLPQSYGRLVPWPVACRNRAFEPFDPMCGLLVLEIQHGIYSFLVACTELILHDIDQMQYSLAPETPEPRLPEPKAIEWPSLTAEMVEAPYRVPQKMDVSRLQTLAGARKAAAEDHLWMLREDPSYFVDSLKDWKEHSQAMMLHRCHRCWQNTASDMLCDAFRNFLSWDSIYRALDSMPSIEDQLKRANMANMRLYSTDEVAWATLLNIIDGMVPEIVMHLRTGLPSSPRMRHCYAWESYVLGSDIWLETKQLSDSESRVNMLFYALTHIEESRLHGLDRLVQEVQYMIDKDASASRHVDSWIAGHFSDLAMLSELSLRINGLEPWSAVWKNAGVLESKAVEISTKMFDGLDLNLRNAIAQAFIDERLISDPMDDAFDYPATQCYSEANVNQMRRAEKALDDFWCKLEVLVKKISSLSINDIITKRLQEPRELYRTSKWVAPVGQHKETTVLEEVSNNVTSVRDTCSSTSIETLVKPKTKIKTRGIPYAPEPPQFDPEASILSAQINELDLKPTIKVPKRAYKVLAALLPASRAANHQRLEIAWDDLLQAMNCIGLQPQKLYGSVWIFKPKAAAQCLVDVKRSIQFHEPKEVRRGSKIPPNMVRTFGRRLKHAYGWESGMFVCE